METNREAVISKFKKDLKDPKLCFNFKLYEIWYLEKDYELYLELAKIYIEDSDEISARISGISTKIKLEDYKRLLEIAVTKSGHNFRVLPKEIAKRIIADDFDFYVRLAKSAAKSGNGIDGLYNHGVSIKQIGLENYKFIVSEDIKEQGIIDYYLKKIDENLVTLDYNFYINIATCAVQKNGFAISAVSTRIKKTDYLNLVKIAVQENPETGKKIPITAPGYMNIVNYLNSISDVGGFKRQIGGAEYYHGFLPKNRLDYQRKKTRYLLDQRKKRMESAQGTKHGRK